VSQWFPPSSENEDIWNLSTVNPFEFNPDYILFNGGDYVRDLPSSAPPIHFDFSTWSSAPAEASSTSTAGTPSLVSSSEPDYLSPPTMLAASPSTPANGLSPVCGVHDFGHPLFPVTPPPPSSPGSNTVRGGIPSIPVAPRPSSCLRSNTVRDLSSILPSLVLTISTIRDHLRSQNTSSHSASTNEAPWCHRSDTGPTPPVTVVATLTKSNSSHVSPFICRSPTNWEYP
jgi:hypothetical protein